MDEHSEDGYESIDEEEIPLNAPKDPRSDFSAIQKMKILQKQAGRCVVCRELLLPKEAVFRHRKWIKGNRATTENGKAVHPKCDTFRH